MIVLSLCSTVDQFHREWKFYNSNRGLFSLSLTHIEMVVPTVTAIGSFVYVAYWLIFDIFFSACSPAIS